VVKQKCAAKYWSFPSHISVWYWAIYLIRSSVSEEVYSLSARVRQSMLKGRVRVGGPPAWQALDPLPRSLQTQLWYFHQSVLPRCRFGVEGNQIELLLVSYLLLKGEKTNKYLMFKSNAFRFLIIFYRSLKQIWIEYFRGSVCVCSIREVHILLSTFYNSANLQI
jgi:hypothetical protein